MTQAPAPIKKSKPAVGASLVVLSSLFYGSYGVWTKLMGNAFGPFTQAAIRSTLVVLCLLTIAFFRKQLKPMQWRRDWVWLALLLFSSFFIAGPLYYATLRAGVGLTAALGYAGILLGMFIFGWLFSKERYTKPKAAATILAVVGLWLIFAPYLHHAVLFPMALALLGGLSMGLDLVAAQKIHYSALQSAMLAWLTGIVANAPLALLFHEKAPSLHWNAHWFYLFVFVAVSISASWAVVQGIKYIEAGAAGILGLLEIVFGVLFGVVIFGERPGVLTLLGMAAIVAAAAIPYFQHFKLKDEPFEL